MNSRLAWRGLRPRWLVTAVLVIGTGLTVGGFALAQSWVSNAEEESLREHAAQTAAIVESYARQVEASLTVGSIIADLSNGDAEVFREQVERRRNLNRAASVALLERTDRWRATTTVGATAPVLLPTLTPADERRLDAVARETGRIELVKIARRNGQRVVALAVSPRDDSRLLVYAETTAPLLERLFVLSRPRGFEFALYIRQVRPDLLVASSARGAEISGNTVEEEFRFGAETAILVVGGSGLVGGLTAVLPWLILAVGLLTTVGLSVVIELSRRRAVAQAERIALVAQNEQLRQLDRLKDELVATVSHELRTPLTSILGYLELLREDGHELSEEHRGFVEVVDRNARRLLGLVGDLLFMARLDAGGVELELDDVDLQEIARECIVAQRPRADRAGIALELESDDVGLSLGDRARLTQLVDNLVANGIKFTPSGGRVVVRLRAVDGNAVLEVEDTGMGIPGADLPHVFDRFFRSSNASAAAIQGTGLGLAISKAIVEAHHGTIAVESKEGVGTTFRVALPLMGARDAPVSAEALVP